MESDLERTPPPVRAALDRANARAKGANGDYHIDAGTKAVAKFSLRDWMFGIVTVMVLTALTYGQFKDIKHELATLQAQREMDRAANAELAASLREFSKSVYDLQMAVLRLESKSEYRP